MIYSTFTYLYTYISSLEIENDVQNGFDGLDSSSDIGVNQNDGDDIEEKNENNVDCVIEVTAKVTSQYLSRHDRFHPHLPIYMMMMIIMMMMMMMIMMVMMMVIIMMIMMMMMIMVMMMIIMMIKIMMMMMVMIMMMIMIIMMVMIMMTTMVMTMMVMNSIGTTS
jgi:hypothetical protein